MLWSERVQDSFLKATTREKKENEHSGELQQIQSTLQRMCHRGEGMMDQLLLKLILNSKEWAGHLKIHRAKELQFQLQTLQIKETEQVPAVREIQVRVRTD